VITLFTTLAIMTGCPKTSTINISGLPWNKDDSENRKHAQMRCGQKFPDAPCLITLVKVDEQIYRAICGDQR
jgi:hypothetical protein